MYDLMGSTALVTGASSGIGRELARQLAARGANLVLVARNKDRLDALRDELGADRPALHILVIAADLAEAASGQKVAEQVAGAGLTVDLLINNAGVGSHGRFVDEDPVAQARQVQLNVGSVVDLTVRFLPTMVLRNSGAVINVASTAAFQPVPRMAVYGATKAFVLSFTEALWSETRGSRVRVFALCPGATETAFFDNTGKSFLTGGRQNPEQVATAALRGLDSSAPSVVSGWRNRIGALGGRLLPRRTLIQLSANVVKESP